jgi:serine/threonine protein kinase
VDRHPSFRQKQKVDHFILEDPLGTGQDGEVWRATRISIGKICAIKFLNSVEEEDKKARFDREIKILASLNHAHIIQIQDKGEAWNPETGAIVPYYVMEFLPAKPIHKALLDLSENNRLEAFCLLFQQICSALDAAHARGISHGDIKPANILVIDNQRLAKLTDFGFGLLPGEAKKARELYPDSSYKAPEGLTPLPADIFRFGKTIMDCLDRLPILKGSVAMRQIVGIATHMTQKPGAVSLSDIETILEQTRTAVLPRSFISDRLSEPVPELDSASNGKLITDPIYGIENFTLRTIRLLDSRVFQRLRSIREIASAELVFPALTISAFEQALGEHALLVRQLEGLGQGMIREMLTPTQLSTVIVAGLILSAARSPFGAVLKKCLPDTSLKMEAEIIGAIEKDISQLIAAEWSVEGDLLKRLIEPRETHRYLDEPEDPDWRLMSDLLSGPLSARSLEWVFRSSTRVGLQTGADIRDLIRALSISAKGQVVIMEGHMRTVEGVYLAKVQASERFLYQSTVRGANLMLEYAFTLLEEQRFDFSRLVELTDYEFFAACVKAAESIENPVALQLLSNYQNRVLHKRLVSLTLSDVGWPYWHRHSAIRVASVITDRLQSRFRTRIESGQILVDIPHYHRDPDLRVLMKDGSLRGASEVSPSFAALQEGPERSTIAIYATPNVMTELQPNNDEVKFLVTRLLEELIRDDDGERF